MDIKSVQSLWQVPSILQYVDAFGTLFSIPYMEIEEFEAALLEKDSFLILELLCRLMEGILTSGRSGKAKGKEKKIWSDNCMSILEEINQRFGLQGWPDKANSADNFFNFSLEARVHILYDLCTLKLGKYEDKLKDYPAVILRPLDLGRDSHGNNYFYFGGTRLYKETPKEARRPVGDEEENEEEPENAARASTWAVKCDRSSDWENFVLSLSSSSHDRKLSKKIRESLLDMIHLLWKEKEAAIQEAEIRQSARVKAKKLREEEEEYVQKKEEKKVRAEEEKERKKREKLERELQTQKKRQEMEEAKKERESRILMRQKRAALIAEGKEIPPELLKSSGNTSASDATSSLDEEMVDKLMKVLKTCFKCRDSWAFQDEVDHRIVPDYPHVIQNPMNLNRMKIKLEEEFYSTVEEFTSDMDLIVSNCKLYNGEDSEYTKMVTKLETCFKRAMDRWVASVCDEEKDKDFVIQTQKRVRELSDSDAVSGKRHCPASRAMNSTPNISQGQTATPEPEVIKRVTLDGPSGVQFLTDLVMPAL